MPTGEIALTWAPSSTPESASSVTVADCPTLILLISDSLNGTVIVIVPEPTISANAELEPLPDDEADEPDEPEPLVVAPDDTESPGDMLARETIVPPTGAYSLVLVELSWAEVGSRLASSWPSLTRWPADTYTSASVPLVWKLTSTSVPAWRLPVPVTVDWTTPSAAVSTSRVVREELVGALRPARRKRPRPWP